MADRWLAGTLGMILFSGMAQAAPDGDRQHEITHLLRHDCGSCHGMTLKGGLGPPLLPGSIRHQPDEVLIDVILHGVPGTPMPPWGFEINRDEAAWLIDRLREGNLDANK